MNLIVSIKSLLLLCLFTCLFKAISAQELNVKKNANDDIMVEPLNGSKSSFFGTDAGLNNTGSFNNFLGYQAGLNNTTGARNNFIGYKAGYKNTTGGGNTFLGHIAGENNTTGSENTFMGRFAGFKNTEGASNTFIGRSAGQNNTTAFFNTFIGSYAGNANTIGFDNTFLGQAAGNVNTTGSLNTFLGRNAGSKNTTSNDNTMVGASAGASNTIGFSNTFLGVAAGFRNLDGAQNTFLGTDAGFNNINGSGNVFIGNQAGRNETESNKLYISNSDAGEENALIYGDFDSKDLRFNADILVKEQTTPTIRLEASGDDEESGRVSLRQGNGSGADILYDGRNFADHFAIETFDSGTSQGKKFLVDVAGNVGVNETSSYTALNVAAKSGDHTVVRFASSTEPVFKIGTDGDGWLAGGLIENSDRRLKKDIVKIEEATTGVQQLAGYRYNWILKTRTQKRRIGVIAQEVQAIYPELVSEDDEGILSVNYSGLSAILIEAVKEQQEVLENQESKIDILMRKLESQALVVSELMAEIKSIRKTLGNNTASVESQK